MLATLADGAIDGDRPFDLGHVSVLADEAPLFLPVPILILGIGAARPTVIKLRRSAHDAMAAVTELRGTKHGIVLRGMGSFCVLERSQDHSIPHMTGCTGHAFLLILLVIVWIWLLDGTFHSVSRNVLDQGRLLVLQRRMAIEADPRMFILRPIGMEEGVFIRL